MCRGLSTLPATCLKSAKDIKHKFSVFLLKADNQVGDHQKPAKEKMTSASAAAAAKRSPSPSELKKWKESFTHVMSSDMGRTVFSSFLKSEFSEENMDFWLACEDYKTTRAAKMGSRAKQIYLQFVEEDAPCEVNLDAVVREETRQNVTNACPSCFTEAQQVIYVLMEKDSYRRFLKSKLVEDLHQCKATAEKKSKAAEKKGCDCAGKRQVVFRGV